VSQIFALCFKVFLEGPKESMGKEGQLDPNFLAVETEYKKDQVSRYCHNLPIDI